MELSFKRKWFSVAIIIVACILVLQFLFIKNAPWVSDYWEHKAVFLELYRHPFSPEHPVVNVNVQHPFFSPYVVAFVFAGRVLSISPDLLLNILSFFNLIFFLCSVVLLERLIVKGENQSKAFVVLLLTILFLWGVYPPYFSSFYHFISLFYTSVYPATFAFCLAVLSGFLHKKIVSRLRPSKKQVLAFLVCVVLNWIILLTHPLTFIFVFSLYVYNYIEYYQLENKDFDKQKYIFRVLLELFFFFVLPLFLAPAWPYYSIWNLFLERSFYGRFHLDSSPLYTGLLAGYYTLILPVILFFYYLIQKDKQTITIGIVIGILLVVYLLGYFSEAFGYGRAISFITLWIHLWFISFLMKQMHGQKMARIVFLIFMLALPYTFISTKSVYKAAITSNGDYLTTATESDFIAKAKVPEMTHRLFAFKNDIDDGAVVMTDLVTSRYVAAFGGKAIASPYSEYWIEDNEIRMADLNRFFNSVDSVTQMELLYKYKPQYLLLNPDVNDIKRILPPQIVNGTIITKNGYILIPLSFLK